MQLSMLSILRKSVSSWKRNPSICAAAQQPHTPLTDHYHVTRYKEKSSNPSLDVY